VVTNHLPAGDPDLKRSLPLAGEDGALADGLSLPDKSPAARPSSPKSFRSRAFKSSTITVSVCVLAWLANLVLAGSYVYERWEQRHLASEIEATLDFVSELPDSGEAQIRLTEAEMALDAEQSAFSTLISSPEVTQELLSLGESVGITILEVVTEPGEVEEVGQNDYGALLVSLQVAGSTEALATFLYELEQGILPGGRVDEVGIEEITPMEVGAPEDPSPRDGFADSVPGWSSHTLLASVAFKVYDRQGSWD